MSAALSQVVACAAVTLGLVVILGLLSLVRSFIEAAHDATGMSVCCL